MLNTYMTRADEAMDDDTKENLSARGTWMRLVYMMLFAIAFYVSEFILVFVVVIQFLFKLISGAPLKALAQLGESLATYVYQIIVFMTFKTEDMPYPFAPWPKGPPAAKRVPRKPRGKTPATAGDEPEQDETS
jgi:hypothetical protein